MYKKKVIFFVFFLLGVSSAYEFYVPKFRNTLYVTSSHAGRCDDVTECSGTGNYPEESIQHSEHGESLKSSDIS